MHAAAVSHRLVRVSDRGGARDVGQAALRLRAETLLRQEKDTFDRYVKVIRTHFKEVGFKFWPRWQVHELFDTSDAPLLYASLMTFDDGDLTKKQLMLQVLLSWTRTHVLDWTLSAILTEESNPSVSRVLARVEQKQALSVLVPDDAGHKSLRGDPLLREAAQVLGNHMRKLDVASVASDFRHQIVAAIAP
jgi:hypothetical protein